MTRFRYWKLTSDEVKKLTHNPDKILNWEIKGVRKPENDAKFNTESAISIELSDVTQDNLTEWGYPSSKLLPIPGK